MDPRLSLLTLGVHDLAAARRFYVEGLGWPPALDVPGAVVFIQVGHGLLLSLYPADELAAEAGTTPGGGATAPMTLAHNVDGPEQVDAILAEAVAAGGTLVAPGQPRDWGGYSGYFADPDGFRWEVAHNPGLTVGPDGTVSLGPTA
jgi:catechol 2,3-dioxygenase-like lactoylglutathione lyase family enzyme